MSCHSHLLFNTTRQNIVYLLHIVLNTYFLLMKRNKLLAIAIDQYEDAHITNLENCGKDVNDMATLLEEKYDFIDIDIY